jgi:1-acyl-sn-glycerol-3-phosphate acyltransferase
LLYDVLKFLLSGFVRIYHRTVVTGMERVPDGPLIVVGNHVSYLDSFYVGALFPRPVHFMAKAEAFENRLAALFLRFAGAFPVNRAKPEVHTIRTALRLLQSGQVVGIFPEGGIKGDNSFQELKQGAAYLAVRSGCPVVPVFIEGTERALPMGSWWIRPEKVAVRFGEVIVPPQMGTHKERQEAVTQWIQQALTALKDAGGVGRTG